MLVDIGGCALTHGDRPESEGPATFCHVADAPLLCLGSCSRLQFGSRSSMSAAVCRRGVSRGDPSAGCVSRHGVVRSPSASNLVTAVTGLGCDDWYGRRQAWTAADYAPLICEEMWGQVVSRVPWARRGVPFSSPRCLTPVSWRVHHSMFGLCRWHLSPAGHTRGSGSSRCPRPSPLTRRL